MSSALSTRRRLTAEPTVPYPKRATGTSTDAMSFRRLRLHEGAELAAYLLEQLIGGAAAKLLQLPLARVHLSDPLARGRARRSRLGRGCSRRTRPCPKSRSACARGRLPT